ncbi:MAG: SitI3 family protein, partial [Actinomycetota bacterium]|nr:SitI3 family protein [Actinomycetota bacterium]
MAIEYALVLAGEIPVEQAAERAVPDLDERPIGVPPLLTVDLNERQGFVLSVRAGRSRYVSAQGDQGWWEWEPSPYISAG